MNCSRLLLFLFIALLPGHVAAQSFFPLDNELGMYCIYFPEGSPEIGLYNESSKDIAFDDFDTQLERVLSLKLAMRKRIKRLSKIIKDNRVVPRERKQFAKLFKQIVDKKFRGKSERIVAAVKQLRRKALKRLKEFEELEVLIADCREQTLTLPPDANGASLQYVEFEFEHPDFNVPYTMFGLAYITTLGKKGVRQGSGLNCLAADSPSRIGDAGRFPKEVQALYTTEICSALVGQLFRKFIRCPVTQAGFSANTGLRWIDINISVTPPSDSRVSQFEREIERNGGVYARPYRKKEGCRS